MLEESMDYQHQIPVSIMIAYPFKFNLKLSIQVNQTGPQPESILQGCF